MLGFLIAPLTNTLRPHFALSKTRLVTLSFLLVGLANCRTVNLSHLASQFPGVSPARVELSAAAAVLSTCPP